MDQDVELAGPRRSSRLKSQHSSSVLPDAAADEDDSGAYVPPHPARKRARTSASTSNSKGKGPAHRRRGNKGKLSGTIQLPLDVLYEIFMYLMPLDLLRLSRLCRMFRDVLLSKHNRYIWKAAIANVGLPEAPSDMNELQWVHLAFDQQCHFCDKIVRTVDWRLRMRICPSCADSSILLKYDISDLHFFLDQLISPVLHNYLTMTGLFLPPSPSVSQAEESDENVMTNIQEPEFEKLVPFSGPNKNHKYTVLSRDLDAVRDAYNKLSDDAARRAYIKERVAYVKERHALALKCDHWSRLQGEYRTEVLRQLREQRKKDVIKRLEDLGWGDEIKAIKYPDSLSSVKNVNKAQTLTDRIWSNIRGPIIKFMEDMRVKRLQREYVALVAQRKRYVMQALHDYNASPERLPYAEQTPGPATFLEFERIATMVNEPAEVTVDRASFVDIFQEYAPLFSSWRQSIRNQLSEYVDPSSRIYQWLHTAYPRGSRPASVYQDDLARPPPSEEVLKTLELATTVFKCKACETTMLFYPQVLAHECLEIKRDSPYICFLDNPLIMSHNNRRYWSYAPWSLQQIEPDETVTKQVTNLINLTSLNPKTATAASMDEDGSIFLCKHCYPTTKPSMIVFSWRGFILHHRKVHRHQEPLPRRINPDEVTSVTLATFDDGDEWPMPCWTCVPCRGLKCEPPLYTMTNMQSHCHQEHAKEGTPVENTDYCRALSVPPKSAFFAKIVAMTGIAGGSGEVADPPSLDAERGTHSNIFNGNVLNIFGESFFEDDSDYDSAEEDYYYSDLALGYFGGYWSEDYWSSDHPDSDDEDPYF